MTRRLLAAAVAVLVFGAASPASADGRLDATGWWWRAQTGLLAPLPPPPGVPEDGLVVGGAPDGPTAVSALRFFVPEQILAATLILEVASDQGGAQAAIEVCPAMESWTPTEAGAWEQRPDADCDAGSVAGRPSEGGDVWFFDVASLADAGLLDLVLQPGGVEDSPAGSTFQIAFEPPSHESLEVTAAAAAPELPDPPPSPGAAAPPPPQPPQAPSEPSGFAAVRAPDPGAPVLEEELPEVADEETAGSAVAPPQVEEQPLVAPEAAPEPAAARQVAALIALACVGAAAAFARQPLPTARGLGRFVRPRQGAPPPLR